MARSICLALISVCLLVVSIDATAVVNCQTEFPEDLFSMTMDPIAEKMAKYAARVMVANPEFGVDSFVDLVNAASQEVAGTNYKLTMKMTAASTGEIQMCEAIVFDPIAKGPTSETRLLRSECASADKKIHMVTQRT